MSDFPVTIAEIEAAAAAIASSIVRTPTIPSPALSATSGANVWLKLETLQRTGAFKERGALNRLRQLDASQRRRGVIAMSAGNHAQAVALHANRLGIPATIVMPDGTPFTKIERTAALGAKVKVTGATLVEARAAAEAIAAERDLVFIHPYDDPGVIAGQGTIALEMLDDAPQLDTLIVPVGGGGLMAGMAVAAKARNPAIRLIGVEAQGWESMRQLLAGEHPRGGEPTLAEGIAVAEPGSITAPIIGALVDDILTVTETDLEAAICALSSGPKLVAEGAGAAGLAALLRNRERFAGRNVGLVVCGGNIDARLLAAILMRGLVRDGRLIRLRVRLPDRPGALAQAAKLIGEAGANIVEVFHQRLSLSISAKRVDADILLETRDRSHGAAIIAALEAADITAMLLEDVG